MANQAFIRPPWPLWRCLAGLSLPVVFYSVFTVWSSFLSPLAQIYISDYAKTTLPDVAAIFSSIFGAQKRGSVGPTRLLYCYRIGDKDFPAIDPLNTSLEAHVVPVPMRTAVYHRWLALNIFHRRPAFLLVIRPFVTVWVIWSVLFAIAYYFDQQRHLRFRDNARHIEGTEMVTIRQFRRRVKGTGMGVRLDLGWRSKLPRKLQTARVLRIQREKEPMHSLSVGDTGAGKTSYIYGIADEAADCGETCIIFDSKGGEFVQRYYDPSRGDIILGLDARAAAWNPSEEIDWTSEATAQSTSWAQAASIYPGDPSRRDWFFQSTARHIWSYCIFHYRPNAAKLGELFEHADPLIDTIVKGTELEETLQKNSSGTRPSIMGTLTTNVVPMLKQIKAQTPDNPGWTAREWCNHRRGWIFLTSTLESRESAGPLHRLWIDSLILRLLSMGAQPNLPKVKMIIDELPTLGELSQLKVAMAEGRQSGLTMVLGFQARAQLKTIYGEDWEAIFSAPYTKLILRTGEPESAEWASRLIGAHRVERVREHRAPAGERSYTTDRPEERLVLAAMLGGLNPRCGYLRYDNFTVPVKVGIAPPRSSGHAGYISQAGNPPAVLPMPNLAAIKAAEEAERVKVAKQNAALMYRPAAQPKRGGRGKATEQDGQGVFCGLDN